MQNLQDKSVLNPESDAGFSGFTTINFPAMPEQIELARTAEYTVTSPWGFPDGIHFYKGTTPLKIPLAFKLHAFDKEYCKEGAKSLLQTAADLQSLVLPFGNSSTPLNSGYGAQGSQSEKNQKNTATGADSAYQNTPENVYPPATCLLELILTERDSVGIYCVGYVAEVRIKLMGPWLRGPNSSRNLPSVGEFEFVFVHHPGHTNSYTANQYSNAGEQQAFAKLVKSNLYNTVNLLTNPQGFVSFNDTSGATSQQQTTTSQPAATTPSPTGNTLQILP